MCGCLIRLKVAEWSTHDKNLHMKNFDVQFVVIFFHLSCEQSFMLYFVNEGQLDSTAECS